MVPAMEPRGQGEDLEVSFGQQRLWFLHELDPQSPAYVIPRVQRLGGRVEWWALEESVKRIVQRHESLRTTFHWKEQRPVQIIHLAGSRRVPLVVVDLRGLEQEQREGVGEALARQEGQRPFDLEQGPLLRVHVLRLEAEEQVLLLTMHHIISDAWSHEIFVRELTTQYRGLVAGEEVQLGALPWQYADYARWQRRWLQGAVLQGHLNYWVEQLRDASVLELPTDHARPAVQSFAGAQQSLKVSEPLSQELAELAQQEGVTLFMLLLASWQVLLARSSGQSDISVGTPIANRTRPEVEQMIGFFVNTLVLRSKIAGEASFEQVLKQVREGALGAYAHQEVPFEQIVEILQPQRSLDRTPLFQVMFTVRHRSEVMEGAPGEDQGEQTIAKFDLSVAVTEQKEGLLCSILYNTDLFDATTIKRMLQHWQTLLQGIVVAPQTPVAFLPLLSETERHRLLVEWNATWQERPDGVSLPILVEAQASCTPDAIAVVDEKGALSYAALDHYANRCAAYLQACGLLLQTPVALCMTRSLDQVIALLAILKAGGIYVPLEPSLPTERQSWILEETGASIVLTRLALRAEISAGQARIICIEECWAQSELPLVERVMQKDAGEQIAYVLYTSGSTGRPKGVMVTQRAIINRLLWGVQDIKLEASDRVVQVASWSFDIALWELFGPLLVGGCVVLAGTQGGRDPRELLVQMQREQITVVHLVPSLLGVLVEEADLSRCESVRCVLCGGERVSEELLRRTREVLPVALRQFYGPTEAAISVTGWGAEAGEEIAGVSIGRGIANTRLYVVDGYGELVPVGGRGELWIAGAGIAQGYWGRAEETAERFVPDPFGEEAGGRVYRTGDIVRYRANGELEYLGRNDEQVKIRGYRIEPREIEQVLSEHEQVRACVVLVQKAHEGDKYLAAYVVGKQPGGVQEDLLHLYLKERLPDYMVPTFIVLLDELPLTTTGKVDRRALPAPLRAKALVAERLIEGRTAIEELLIQIWSEVLPVERLSVDDNFFASGGHSLLATRVMSRIRAVLRIELPLRMLFEAPTIRELGQKIEHLMGGREQAAPVLVTVPRTEKLPLSFAQQRLWFLDQLEALNSAYLISKAVRLEGHLDYAALEQSFKQLVQRHESLRTTFQVRDDQPIQVIEALESFLVPLVDLRGVDQERREREMWDLMQQEVEYPCDLAKGPLLRVRLLRVQDDAHVLLVTMHHIISDGWSCDVFLQELRTLYQAIRAGEAAKLLPLPVQYADFALWQRQWLQGDTLQAQLDYWKKQLSEVPILELPTDHPRPAIQRFQGDSQTLALSPRLQTELRVLSQRSEVTLFMTLLASFQVLLQRYSGQSDIAIGTPVANRGRAELEGLIGFFVNTLVLRADLSGNPTFEEILQRVREVALGAYGHQDIPFEQLVEVLRPQRDLSRLPLFQVMFSLQYMSKERTDFDDLQLRELDINNRMTKFDLTVIVTEQEQELCCNIQYNVDLFEAATIHRLLEHWQTLLQGIVANPQARVGDLPLLSEEERQQVLVECNGRSEPLPIGETLWELFKRQEHRCPDAIALVSEQGSLSYGALEQMAGRVASYLQRLGVRRQQLVGLCLERSLEAAGALLGILRLGAVLVPLEPSLPTGRLRQLLAETQAPVVLTRRTFSERLAGAGVVVGEVEACWEAEAAVVSSFQGHEPGLAGAELAYVLYTSGSTGRPKGVMVPHAAICNRIGWGIADVRAAGS